MTRANIGCGDAPTTGWLNFDGSLTLKLARIPGLTQGLGAIGMLDRNQKSFAEFAKRSDIRYADATRHIPLPSDSIDALYSAHMLEHLYPDEARSFLAEARRVLRRRGVIRISIPDLRLLVNAYVAHQDANQFMNASLLSVPPSRGVVGQLRQIVVGNRHHLWMYDGASLCKLLTDCGFVEAQAMAPGTTRILDPGHLNLLERADESVYVEAIKP